MKLFKFSAIITLSSGILYVISIVLPYVYCLVTRMIPGLLNLHSIYLIPIARVQYYYFLCILLIYVAAGTLPSFSKASEILVHYSMIRASA